ncbi:hypothetical protein ARC20_16035 [Stenotrophomonas panacihumi]|uniref:Uncharacterized protein n=2 Tax=Stenotrophomonas panacihumi TaxID=676599 RepID=A0A0Q9ZY30_9GAMM|nr:hypothetical protein ARC20_16035 [Stenotrophomonas panacihumi]PTN53139.1 hypothetical protein C9J98_17135 [Stenotrophomonas panacihumi]
MLHFALLAGAMSLPAAAQDAPPRTPPAPNCLDAREVAEMRQPDPRTLAVATTDKRYYRLGLQQDCPGLEGDSEASLWGREGWICGGGREFARGAGRDCPIVSSQAGDAAAYARDARLADQNGPRTLATVEVRGKQQRPGQRGFRGTTSYCFAPRYMRAWSEDPQGVVVEVSPVHSGGNRYYRVELASSCPALANATTINFVSGMDLGIICGNAGDALVVQQRSLTAAGGSQHPMFSRPGGMPLSIRDRCTVSAVYPRP